MAMSIHGSLRRPRGMVDATGRHLVNSTGPTYTALPPINDTSSPATTKPPIYGPGNNTTTKPPIYGPGNNFPVTTKPVIDQPNTTTPHPDLPSTTTTKPVEPNVTTPHPDLPSTTTSKPAEPNNTTSNPNLPSTTTPKPITISDIPTTTTPVPTPTPPVPASPVPTTTVPTTPGPTTSVPQPDAEARETPTVSPPVAPTTPSPVPIRTWDRVPITTSPTPSAITTDPPQVTTAIETTIAVPPVTASTAPVTGAPVKDASPAINRGASNTSGPDENTIVFIIAGVAVCVGIVLIITMLVTNRQRRRKPLMLTPPISTDIMQYSPQASYENDVTPGPFSPNDFRSDHVLKSIRIPFDQITLGAFLSRGAFGDVLKATCRGETVVVKRLVRDRRFDALETHAFTQEIKLMTTLEHPRIVRLLGAAWESPSTLCAVVEYMQAGDVRTWLKKRHAHGHPVGFNHDKLKIALHVVEALEYLHSLQPTIIHRDLKSKNIVLSANGDAKLTDFGVSRERCEATMTSEVGSALWMAPEIISGGYYDEKADMFSFGVLLSELDTQVLPYQYGSEGRTPLSQVAVLNLVQEGHLTVPFTGGDDELTAAARACVALDPRARPSAADMRALLQLYVPS